MSLQIRPHQPGDAEEIARLCWAYRSFLSERTAPKHPDIVETYYGTGSYARLIADLPRIHTRPLGDILLAELDGAVCGIGMYYPLKWDGVCEIKRVYVDPSARGTGAGRALMQDAMRRAKADGYTRMVLDTMFALTEAIALYRSLGFETAEPFYELNPKYADAIRFLGRDL